MYFYNAEQLLCLNLFPIISSKLLKKAFRTISSDSSPCIKRFTQNLTNANHTIQSWQPTTVLLSDPSANHADLSVVIFLFFSCLPAISLFKHFSHFPSLFFFSSSDQIFPSPNILLRFLLSPSSRPEVLNYQVHDWVWHDKCTMALSRVLQSRKQGFYNGSSTPVQQILRIHCNPFYIKLACGPAFKIEQGVLPTQWALI